MNSSPKHFHVCLLKHRLGHIGGLEKSTWRLASAFAAKGCTVTILTSSPVTSQVDHPLITLQSVGDSPSFYPLLDFEKKCRRWIEKHGADAVFGMDRTRFQTHLRAGNGVHKAFLERKALFQSPLSQTFDLLRPSNHLTLKLEEEAFQSPSLKTLFTNSHMTRNEILRFYDTPAHKIQVVHNGVEWHEYEKPFSSWVEKKVEIARSLDLDPSLFHFVFVGNGFKRKGLAPLLEALAALPYRDFHLSVVGKDKEMASYIKKALSLGINSKVSFFGERSDVTKFYQLADCAVIPSFYDPFANVTVEALAMGLYVVSSSFNGGSEVLTPLTGTVIPWLNEKEGFISSLMTAMDHPKTWNRSQEIRNNVKRLDYSNTLSQIVDNVLL